METWGWPLPPSHMQGAKGNMKTDSYKCASYEYRWELGVGSWGVTFSNVGNFVEHKSNPNLNWGLILLLLLCHLGKCVKKWKNPSMTASYWGNEYEWLARVDHLHTGDDIITVEGWYIYEKGWYKGGTELVVEEGRAWAAVWPSIGGQLAVHWLSTDN